MNGHAVQLGYVLSEWVCCPNGVWLVRMGCCPLGKQAVRIGSGKYCGKLLNGFVCYETENSRDNSGKRISYKEKRKAEFPDNFSS